MDILDLLPEYPEGCTEQQQYDLQQNVRAIMGTILPQLDHLKNHDWPKYFWRRNFELVRCLPFHAPAPAGGSEPVSKTQEDKIRKLATNNAELAVEYLNEVAGKHSYDLYDPRRDEVLLGLFSRLTRLFSLAITTPPLWAPDLAGIMLRCLADTAITFAYLTKCGTPDEFESFISYGEGKEKLLMLHLQDQYSTKKSVEGKTSEDIANDLGGGFMPEMINIELADWTKKSARELALEADMGEVYRLVYDPSSSHLHGTWMSIQRTNLIRCAQPMHRFHRIPQFFEPPLYVNTLISFSKIYETAVQVGIEKLRFPASEPSPIKALESLLITPSSTDADTSKAERN